MQGLAKEAILFAGAPFASFSSAAGFGDSITAGTGATTAAQRWLNIVAGVIGASGNLLNAGIAGTVLQNSAGSGGSALTNNGRDRYSTAILGANKKASLFIAYGYNDARYTGAPATFNVTQFTNDYRETLNGSLINGYTRDSIFIISPYYITDAGLSSGSAGFTGQTRSGFFAFVTAASDVAKEYGVRFVDIYTYMLNNGGAALIGPDDIHPTNAGHAVIAAGVQTSAYNNLKPVPGISASTTGSTVNVTMTAPSSGTVSSYDFELIADPVSSATTTSATTSASFTSVADGTYSVKARAVFDDGLKSPWVFSSPLNVSASGPGTTFLNDTFTDTAGTAITAHTGETGATWTVQTGFTPASPNAIDASNMLYSPTTSGVYQASGVPPSADYYVEAVLSYLSTVTGDSVGITARASTSANTFYFARYNRANGGFQLFKTVAGTSNQLGTTQSDTFASGTRTLRLTVQGTTISLAVGGATLVSVTDSAISTAGRAGVRFSVAQTSTTGIHIDSIAAVSL